ncbi:MAG: DUF1624 domain-containing protein [Winogradskyella sp.]|nr:DUF1624 domain-containing protein [Winogradskyella sp.]
MTIPKSHRIESIDILRGIVMVIMALDHVRDYFHYGSFFIDPTNLETTTPTLFFTRFITHYCAPVFIFLAGTSAYLYGQKNGQKALSKFLFTRGIWLVFLEIVLNNLIWWFDIYFSMIALQVIWAIGLCMIVLSILIKLPYKLILGFGLILIFGHNLLDGIVMQGRDLGSILWYIFHQMQFLPIGSQRVVIIAYPILPWIGVICTGYALGKLYTSTFSQTLRRKYLVYLGVIALTLFFVIRGINAYGDLVPWTSQKNTTYTILSFFNVTKYPPSLAFLLVTLGPALILLAGLENIKNRMTNFFLVFGRVPFMYYFLHVLVIHLLAMVAVVIQGRPWYDMIITSSNFKNALLIDYGFSLWVVYGVWISVILLLYPISKRYMIYKINHKEKWWLSYL